MSDDEPRQRVERVRGSRRARLTRVEGTLADSEAEATLRGDKPDPVDPSGFRGPNDARLRQDVPPHYS
ncbi:hypothetical protein [Microbacterium sp. G2-8]|uniref:hypothetical protein n=1 Tax=Microbacterium sp. G2-8 TaxID=2842454 RepID=UPI001C8A7CBC|nr:hypothetical protein [Microbacterium sp. G2-8]